MANEYTYQREANDIDEIQEEERQSKKVMCGKCMKLIREEPLGSSGVFFDKCEKCSGN